MYVNPVIRTLKKLFVIPCVVVVLMTLSVCVSGQNAFYVDSRNGNDNNKGKSPTRAFKTIVKAQNAVRTINRFMETDITVYLRGGVHELSAPLALTAQDGGTNGHYIVYKPFNCEKPIISGGIRLTNWILHDPINNIYRSTADLPVDSRQLYVNGVRATRARSVDAAGWTENGDGYTCPAEVSDWKNISDVEVVSYMVWKCHRGPLASVSGTHATMAQPYWDNLHLQFVAPPVWIENAYELLDSEGEWYLERSTSTIYYKPRVTEDISKADVVLAKQETLLSCKEVRNVEFKEITFAHATWLTPNSPKGFACHQADEMITTLNWLDFKQMPGNITLEHSENVKITSCVFKQLGSTALQLLKGCKNNIIYNNSFTDVSGSAISIGPLNDSFPTSTDLVKDNIVNNNFISNVAVEYRGCVGIIVGHTDHTVISHNEIRNLPYTAISLGWGWSNSTTVAKDNEVSFNLIDSVVTVLNDGGAIYTQSAQHGTEIHNNYIKNEINDHAGLYIDQGSSYMRWHSNVLENVYRWIDLTSDECIMVTADFNYSDNSSYLFGGTECILVDNVFVENNNWPSEAVRIMNEAGRFAVERCPSDANPLAARVIDLYSNPTLGILNISLDSPFDKNFIIELYDTQGRRLQNISKDKSEIRFSIDLSKYSPGLYLVRIVSGDYSFIGKVIKR